MAQPSSKGKEIMVYEPMDEDLALIEGEAAVEELEEFLEIELRLDEKSFYFEEEVQKAVHARYSSSSNISPGFTANIEWCRAEGLVEFAEIIEFQGWEFILGDFSAKPLPLDLLGEFVSNAVITDLEIQSVVQYTKLELTVETLETIFNVPAKGVDIFGHGFQSFGLEGVSDDEIIEFFGGTPGTRMIQQKDFRLGIHKLLFVLVWRWLLPRKQKRNQANMVDLGYMYCLITKVPINFPSLFLRHLTHTIQKQNYLGYGSLLNYIFQSFNILTKNSVPHSIFLNHAFLNSLSLEIKGTELIFTSQPGKKRRVIVSTKPKPSKPTIPSTSATKRKRTAPKKLLTEQSHSDDSLSSDNQEPTYLDSSLPKVPASTSSAPSSSKINKGTQTDPPTPEDDYMPTMVTFKSLKKYHLTLEQKMDFLLDLQIHMGSTMEILAKEGELLKLKMEVVSKQLEKLEK